MYDYILYYYVCNQLLPIVVEKTVKLSGLWREFQCILSTQSEIGLFPAGEGSLFTESADRHAVKEFKH